MKNPLSPISRRSFIKGFGAVGGAVFAARTVGAVDTVGAMPMRVLGKTGVKVSALALGTWPCGMCEDLGVEGAERLVHEALDLGVNFIDTARVYGHGEQAVGRAIRGRRDGLFLTTKTWADTAEEARVSLEQSLRELQTDHVDLVYLHSMGDRNPERVRGDGGALQYLLEQKIAGKTRFVGISGHSRVPHFVPLIESGKIDVVMVAMNFVDRYTYGFEDKVLPTAIASGCGVCCMKVFGGMRGGFAAASGPNTGPEIRSAYLQHAVRYAMGLPGVATLVIGPHTVAQLRQNAAWVRDYAPLSAAEQGELENLGRQWAKTLGPHYGPVA